MTKSWASKSWATSCRGRNGAADTAAFLAVLMVGTALTLMPAAVRAAETDTAAPVHGVTAPAIDLAQDAKVKDFDIPAQALADALKQYAEATGVSFAYKTGDFSGLHSPGVSGAMTAAQALARLLAGSGITFEFTGARTVALSKPTGANGPAKLGPVTITATREGGALDTLSRNVTVISRQDIEQQQETAQGVADLLTKFVPGMAPSSQTLTNSSQTLRGRSVLVLIDGVPMTTNRNISRDLFNISTSNIESIEVVNGGSSVYGGGAAGGVIHINTLKPKDGEMSFETTVAGTSSLTHLDPDGLGGRLEQRASGKRGGVDYVLSFSGEQAQGFYDADGDRIAPEPSQGDLADTGTYDVLAKVGYDLEDQRFQATFSYLNANQDTNYASDPAVTGFATGAVKARALSGLSLEDQTANENLLLNLDYSHKNVLGSEVQAQAYYRNYHSRFSPFDGRNFSAWNALAQTYLNSETFGGRLTVDTPVLLVEGLDAKLLWGIDVNHEKTEQPADTYDGGVFDASGGTVFVKQGVGRTFVPMITTKTYGVFGQAEVYPLDNVILRGGVRHEWVDVSYPSYTTMGQGNAINAGELSYAETTFNAGAVYSPVEAIDLYANYSQSFELPDIGLQLRSAPSGFDVTNSNLASRITDNYEVGVRGKWRGLHAGLAAFVSRSDLGQVAIENFSLVQQRTPERIYGIEAQAAYRVNEQLHIGGTVSWLKGEQRVANSEDAQALNGFRIPPMKITSYIDYRPYDWWQLRLQAMFSGERDDATDDGVSFGGRKVEDYTVLDLYSAFDVGRGTLKVGLENLLNNQYYTVFGQLLRNSANTSHLAARGLTLRVAYSVEW
ncbi:MAG: TonB-dependent receptor [Rhodospirillales bacterium]